MIEWADVRSPASASMARLGYRLVEDRYDLRFFGNWILEFGHGRPWSSSKVRFTNDRGQLHVDVSGSDRLLPSFKALQLSAPATFLQALENLS